MGGAAADHDPLDSCAAARAGLPSTPKYHQHGLESAILTMGIGINPKSGSAHFNCFAHYGSQRAVQALCLPVSE